MKSILSICAIALAFVFGTSAHASVPALVGGAADLSATFSIDAPTTVPGKTLKRGTYSIHVVDHLSDRVLLQIEDSKGKQETRFLAVPNAALPHTSGVGPISYAEAKHQGDSLRGFAFPGGSAVEFVYPKEQAANIAKLSGASVLAIDPASEGRPVMAKLSKDDMDLVTLWTLSPTRIGPESASQAAIQAQRYQPAPQPASVQPIQVASANDVPPAPRPRSAAAASTGASAAAPQTPSVPRPVRAVKRTSAITSLPHTASELPLVLLSGLLLLGAALVLRIYRAQFGVR